jgi:aminoglycoside 3-N-acetyltransferase I
MEKGAPFVVSRLSPLNVTPFRQLLSVFGRAFDEVDTYIRKQPRQTYLEDLLGRAEFIALAALAEGHVIGGLVAYELRKFEQERSEIYIDDPAVDAAHRRRRVATALIEHLKGTLGVWRLCYLCSGRYRR